MWLAGHFYIFSHFMQTWYLSSLGLVAFESYCRTPVGSRKERKGKAAHVWMFPMSYGFLILLLEGG